MKSSLFVFILTQAPLLSAAEPKPNVILILSDDHGFTDYGFMGHPVARTPNLDRMASESLLCNAFTSAPEKVELFDLKTDPMETRNLATEKPDEVARLEALLPAK